MRITFKGDYALKAVLDLAVHYDTGLVTINEIAERIDAPVKFLEQILSDLKRGGFVESRRGKVGGYLLSRPPMEIKVGDVVRFIDGPIEPISCVDENYENCFDIKKCIFRGIWKKVANSTAQIIDNISFEDLRNQVQEKQDILVYSI